METTLASAYDVFPTLLDNLGLPEHHDPLRPGRSLVPLLLGEPVTEHDEVLVFDEYGPVRMIRTPEWKYVHRYPERPGELYDMVNDPGERNNLIDDGGQRRRIADLRGRMEEWFDRHSVPAKNGRDLPVKGMGQNKPVDRGADTAGMFNPVGKEWFVHYEEGMENA